VLAATLCGQLVVAGIHGHLLLVHAPQQSFVNMKPDTRCLCSAERHKEAWIGRAENMFAQCQAHPGVLAFMMDQWAELLEQQGPAAAAAAEGQQQPELAAAATPKPMLEWLSEKVQVSTHA
jgi:hypothetical protein